MSNFTDRMVAAGVPLGVAEDIEGDLIADLRKAKAEKQRLTTQIDTRETEVVALKTQRAAVNQIIDGIRLALNDPTA
jgi:predicted  nucleic acid-binding Zn-ribbon protein